MDNSKEISKFIKINAGIIEFITEHVNFTILFEIKKLVLSNISYGDIIWPSTLPNDMESKELIEEIENLLKQNNTNYSRFSSDFIHGILSYHVYGDINEGDSPFDINEKKNNKIEKILKKSNFNNKNSNRWKIIKVFKLEKSYQSALYFNEYMGHLVLAHKGIESKIKDIFKENSSLNNQIEGVICKEYVPQLLKCYEVTAYCYRTAIEKNCTLSFTGYSNGAWLSEYSIYFCEKYIKQTFKGECKVDIKAILFESPGILRDENETFSNIISSEIEFDIGNLNIVNYLISPNLMNSCNKHIGKVYRLFIKNKEKDQLNSQKFFDKIKNIKLIGNLLSDTMEKSRFIYNGLYYTFDHSVLRLIIEECFENEKPINFCQMQNWPLVKIDFDKDYKDNFKNYLAKPIDFFVKFLPENLSILTEPIKFITSNLGKYLAEKSCPGIVILINILIELSKSNMNLDYLNNELFFIDAESIEKITIDQKYIEDKYDKKKLTKQEKITQEEIQKKIRSKFSLFYSSNYVPIIISDKSKRLNISNDYDQNLDWCFYNLKQKYLEELNFKSKIIYHHLLDLKTKYEITSFKKGESSIHIIEKIEQNFDFERLKEFFLRLISISSQDLRSIISPKESKNVLAFSHNLGQRIKFTSRGNIIQKINNLFKQNNSILLFGPPATGKTTIAKEFGFEKLAENYNVRIFNSEKELKLLNEYRSFAFNILNLKINNSKIDELIDIANNLIIKSNVKTLFIFDNVENFEFIMPFLNGLLHSKLIKILITTRNQNIINSVEIEKIKIDFFNDEEAYEFIKKYDNNELDKSKCDFILSKLKINNEINPKELEVTIKFLNKNFFFDKSSLFNVFESGTVTLNYVFDILGEEKYLLKSISKLNPDKISIDVLRKIVNNAEMNYFEILETYGLIEINKKERCISIHRLVRKDVQKYFGEDNDILNSLLNCIEKENDSDLEEYYEHLDTINEETVEVIADINDAKLKMKIKLQKFYLKKNVFSFLIKLSKEIYETVSKLKKYEDEELAEVVFNYAQCLNALSYFEAGKKYFLEAYEMQKRLYKDADHSQIANSLYSLAVSYSGLGDDHKAKEYDLQAYEMRKRLYDDADHSEIAESLNSLAVSYSRLGDDHKAKEYYLRAYEMRKRLYNDADNSEIAKSLYSLAVNNGRLGDFEKAKEYFLQAYEMQKRLYKDADHSEIAESLRNLAVSYSRLGDDYKAKEYNLKAYEMQKRLYNDADHLVIAQSLNDLGNYNGRLGEAEIAKEYYLKAYKMRKSLFKDADHSDIAESLHSLADGFESLGDDHKALKYYLKAYKMRKRLYKDSDHTDIAQSLFNLAVCNGKLGNFEKAEDNYLKAYKMRKRLYKDADHSDIAESLNSLGISYTVLGDHHKALEYYLQSYQMRKRLYKDADHSEVAQSIIFLAISYESIGDDHRAKKYYLKAYKMRKRLYKDADHSDIAESLNFLAVCYEKLGDVEKAKKYYLKENEIRERLFKE